MARVQDFQTVTPTDSDNLLVVQATGQGLATVGSTLGAKMDKANPTGTGSFALNKLSGSTIGANAVTEGSNNTASGTASHAEGTTTIASGSRSHTEGESTQATGDSSHAEGLSTVASGSRSHAEGAFTIANRRSQHVFGEFNVADTGGTGVTTKGNYIEIVGKGTSDTSRSNARTLDWQGNEVLAGDLTINGNVSVGNAITPYYYNANTDRNTQENRETAIKYVLTNYFSKGGTLATIRYSGGYYNSYIYCGGSSSNLQIIEFCQLQSSGEKVIYWMYTTSNNELNKIFALS